MSLQEVGLILSLHPECAGAAGAGHSPKPCHTEVLAKEKAACQAKDLSFSLICFSILYTESLHLLIFISCEQSIHCHDFAVFRFLSYMGLGFITNSP